MCVKFRETFVKILIKVFNYSINYFKLFNSFVAFLYLNQVMGFYICYNRRYQAVFTVFPRFHAPCLDALWPLLDFTSPQLDQEEIDWTLQKKVLIFVIT